MQTIITTKEQIKRAQDMSEEMGVSSIQASLAERKASDIKIRSAATL